MLIILGFLLAFIIRLSCCQNTLIINPDGPKYICQARAVYYGQWKEITSCQVAGVSNYPFFIAGAYVIFRDWVTSAKFVSLLFGFATLIPLYLVLRSFFEEEISLLATLVIGLTPVLVRGSADVIKDPLCWFFITLGLYFFVDQMKARKGACLILSCFSFLLAAWARPDAIFVILISLFYLVAVEENNRIKRGLFFVLPLFVGALLLLGAQMVCNFPAMRAFRIPEILMRLSGPFNTFHSLQIILTDISNQTSYDILKYFLPEVKNSIWLVTLGTLLNRSLEAFFYPYFVIVALGMAGMPNRIRKDRRIIYFGMLTIFSVLLLYFHTLRTWSIEYRHMIIVIIFCSVFTGFGLQKVISIFQSKLKLKREVALSIVFFLVLAFALPKDLMPRGNDRLVFKEIAAFIASKESENREIAIATSQCSPAWIPFYANLNYRGTHCSQSYDYDGRLFENDENGFVQDLRHKGVRYFVWEEKHWPAGKLDLIDGPFGKEFRELGRWYHPITGEMILFEKRNAL